MLQFPSFAFLRDNSPIASTTFGMRRVGHIEANCPRNEVERGQAHLQDDAVSAVTEVTYSQTEYDAAIAKARA